METYTQSLETGVQSDTQPLEIGVQSDTQALEIGEVQPRRRLWQGEARNALLVVMTLVMTLSFQIAMNPPWGCWQDDENGHTAGTPIMRDKDRLRYIFLLVFNFWGFFCSSSLVLSLLSENQIISRFDRIYFTVSFSSLMVTYGLAQISYVAAAVPFIDAAIFLVYGYIVLK